MTTYTEEQSPTYVAVGALVRKAREAQGLTQVEMTERLASVGKPMGRVTYNRLENGHRDISLGEMDTLARVLGVPVEQLYPPLSREAALWGVRDHRLTISALDMALDAVSEQVAELRRFIVVQSRRIDAQEVQL